MLSKITLLALSLFTLNANRVNADPSNGITEVDIFTTTVQSCNEAARGRGVPTTQVAVYEGACGCYSATDLPSGATVCPNDSSTCVNKVLFYSNGKEEQSATCSPCDPSKSNCMYGSDKIYQNKCKNNDLYAVQASSTQVVCVCGDEVNNFGDKKKQKCEAPENGYAFCETKQNDTNMDDVVIKGSCGFDCNSGYKKDASTFSCVKDIGPSPSSRRRALKFSADNMDPYF